MSRMILYIGPSGSPRTGQSLAAETWLRHTIHDVITINTNVQGASILQKIYRFMQNVALTLFFCLKYRTIDLYISSKRSVFGALTDACYISAHVIFCRGLRVAHIHGADFDRNLRSPFSIFIFSLLFMPISKVITLTSGMARPFLEHTKCDCIVINNFSNVVLDNNEMEKKVYAARKGSCLKVLFLSNIIYSKGAEILIKTIDKLTQEGEPFELHLAGRFMADDYKSSREMAQLVGRYKANINIFYWGPVDGEKKWELLHDADIVALPTFYKSEAQPLTLLEGLCTCNAIVTTKHNFNEDFLSNYDINYCQPDNCIDLIEALQKARGQLRNKRYQIKQNYVKASNEFSISSYVSKIDIIFNRGD